VSTRATIVTTVVLSLLLMAPATTGSAAPDAVVARDKAVSWAVKQLGTRDPGKTNCTARINGVCGMGLRIPPCRPWCGAFVHAAFRQAGVRLSARLIDPHRSYQDAGAGRRGLKRIAVTSLRRGDVLFMALRKGLLASHMAIARGPLRKGRIPTVEGNVSHRVTLTKRASRMFVVAARVVG
jgi:cell wall-associated NlpC family hydrolase